MNNVLTRLVRLMMNDRTFSAKLKHIASILGLCLLSMNSAFCVAASVVENEAELSSAALSAVAFDAMFTNAAVEYVYSAQLGERTFFTLRTSQYADWNGLWEQRQDKMIFIKAFVDVGELTAIDDSLYFYAQDHEFGAELWKSDGTKAGTRLVKDIHFGQAGSKPSYLTRFNQYVLFFATDLHDNLNLWCTDGTAQGTMMVKHFQVGIEQQQTLDWDWLQLLREFYQVVERRVYASQKQSDTRVILVQPTVMDDGLKSLPSLADIGRY